MPWNLDSDRPIFQQIIDKIETDIHCSQYSLGDKLLSVRVLGMMAAVNPNTMQKAITELARSGLVYTQRTSGRFITEDVGMIELLKERKAKELIDTYLEGMQRIGYDRQTAAEALMKNS